MSDNETRPDEVEATAAPAADAPTEEKAQTTAPAAPIHGGYVVVQHDDAEAEPDAAAAAEQADQPAEPEDSAPEQEDNKTEDDVEDDVEDEGEDEDEDEAAPETPTLRQRPAADSGDAKDDEDDDHRDDDDNNGKDKGAADTESNEAAMMLTAAASLVLASVLFVAPHLVPHESHQVAHEVHHTCFGLAIVFASVAFLVALSVGPSRLVQLCQRTGLADLCLERVDNDDSAAAAAAARAQ